jgi:hypothetical protein
MNLICFTGKQKYTLPIYKALMKSSSEMKQFAEKVFDETKMMLHINVRGYSLGQSSVFIHIPINLQFTRGGHHDSMVVGFTTTCAICLSPLNM